MKKLLVAATALSGFLALTNASMAADPIIVDTTYDWSGAYVGLQGGYGWADVDIDDGVLSDPEISGDGAFGGLYAGWNFQFDQIVMGIEGDINIADIDGDESDAGVDVKGDIDWFGSVRGRLGFAWDRMLIFATGGVAFTEVDTKIDLVGLNGSDDLNYTGWVVGGGLDFAAWENMILRAEYRYYDFGHEDFSDAGFSDSKVDLTMQTVSVGIAWKF